MLALVHDPAHKDHARGIGMVLARTDPEIERHYFNVTHTVLDPDAEALEELRVSWAPQEKNSSSYSAATGF